MSYAKKKRELASKVKEDIEDEKHDVKKYAHQAKRFHKKEFTKLSHEEAEHKRRLERMK